MSTAYSLFSCPVLTHPPLPSCLTCPSLLCPDLPLLCTSSSLLTSLHATSLPFHMITPPTPLFASLLATPFLSFPLHHFLPLPSPLYISFLYLLFSPFPSLYAPPLNLLVPLFHFTQLLFFSITPSLSRPSTLCFTSNLLFSRFT